MYSQFALFVLICNLLIDISSSKFKDLSVFVSGQIIIARQQGRIISKQQILWSATSMEWLAAAKNDPRRNNQTSTWMKTTQNQLGINPCLSSETNCK